MFGGVNASSEIRLAGVAAHHALAVAAGHDLADRFLHHRNPATTVGAIERQDRPFEHIVEVLGLLPVASLLFAVLPTGHTRPPCLHTPDDDAPLLRAHAP